MVKTEKEKKSSKQLKNDLIIQVIESIKKLMKSGKKYCTLDEINYTYNGVIKNLKLYNTEYCSSSICDKIICNYLRSNKMIIKNDSKMIENVNGNKMIIEFFNVHFNQFGVFRFEFDENLNELYIYRKDLTSTQNLVDFDNLLIIICFKDYRHDDFKYILKIFENFIDYYSYAIFKHKERINHIDFKNEYEKTQNWKN